MTDSKRELIVQNLVAILGTISTADAYNYDITALDIDERLFYIDELGDIRMPRITVTTGIESATVALMGSPPKYRGTFPVFIQGFIKSQDKTAIRTMVERLLHDVRKIIFIDMTRGGYAFAQRLMRVQTDQGTLAYEGYGVFEIELEILYDYTTDAP